MAEFLKDSQVLIAIEELIDNADQFLLLISPYIKLHERVKTKLRQKMNKPELEVVLIFGKNEDDTSKSLSKDGFEFLKQFPNITIGYEKRLHAKYYASEEFSIVTSMNLHEFSQNNNIEVAIKLMAKNWLEAQLSTNNLDKDGFDYFQEVAKNCLIIYKKKPKYKSGLLGLTSTYINSEVVIDESENFFKKKETFQGKKFYHSNNNFQGKEENGYCIRTGRQIPFNFARPMCKDAYDSWSQYKNPDYPEKYCHKTGNLSNGKTSMRNPVL